ncbi:MAG TPA: helix-turn-helix domain-containing protein [Pyrinomonadaceae bacterium]|jgi:excisionase family DNA binding protein|nr:helix-turn-helix domain-containing protein [Pyrinomonadaceae bacterium]
MKMMTTSEVAERLGVHVTRVRALIVAERLPAQKLGRDYVIREADLKLVEDRKPGRPPKNAMMKGKK